MFDSDLVELISVPIFCSTVSKNTDSVLVSLKSLNVKYFIIRATGMRIGTLLLQFLTVDWGI